MGIVKNTNVKHVKSDYWNQYAQFILNDIQQQSKVETIYREQLLKKSGIETASKFSLKGEGALKSETTDELIEERVGKRIAESNQVVKDIEASNQQTQRNWTWLSNIEAFGKCMGEKIEVSSDRVCGSSFRFTVRMDENFETEISSDQNQSDSKMAFLNLLISQKKLSSMLES